MLWVFIFLNVNKNDGGNNTYKKKPKGKCYVTSKLSRCLFMNWVFYIILFAYHRIMKKIHIKN